MAQAIQGHVSAIHLVVRILPCANTPSYLKTWTQAKAGPSNDVHCTLANFSPITFFCSLHISDDLLSFSTFFFLLWLDKFC